MKKACYILDPNAFTRIYGEEEQRDLESRVTLLGPPTTPAAVATNPAPLGEMEILLSGWGGPCLDEAFLDAAPKLDLLLYGAGSVRGIMTEAAWDRGIRVVSAYRVNGEFVAQFSVAQIILSLKRVWHYAVSMKKERHWPAPEGIPGTYRSTAGIISLGAIGRRVCTLLKPFGFHVLAYDPFVEDGVFASLDAERCGLEEIFSRSHVVSLHTPWLPETEGMVTGAHLAALPENGCFINTARGAVVREAEMVGVLARRPDLTAVLDVTYPEPPAPDSALFALPNVVLTPHIAGAMGRECNAMGRCMVAELDRYLAGAPLQHEITREQAKLLA